MLRRLDPLLHSPWLPCLVFLAMVLGINADLFRVPIVEHGDLALNSIQVQDAKAFRELLGNYSRWHFHHPGPAVFYLLGAGEALFYDLPGLVPAPLNAQLLTIILFNTACLFGTLAIFRRHSPGPLFPPMAVGLSVLFLVTVNRTLPGGALLSLWMPQVLLFPFLLFTALGASVAAGDLRRLPWLAACGMLLIHMHVAQLLFVGGLGLAVAAAVAWRARESGDWRGFLRGYRRQALGSIAIVALFAVPPLIEIAIHHPNNLDAIRAYMRGHPGSQWPLVTAVRYYGSFWAHVGKPEEELPRASLAALALSKPYVVAYDALLALLAAAAAVLWRRHGKPPGPFLRFILLECVLASALFVFWATRIAGELFSFNGFFVFSIQLLFSLACASAIAGRLAPRRPAVVATVLYTAALGALVLVPSCFANTYHGVPDVLRIARSLPAPAGPVRLVFYGQNWARAAGIANALKRQHKPFCVTPDWGFAFGYGNVCGEAISCRRLLVNPPALLAASGCAPLGGTEAVEVLACPPPWSGLPLDIGPRDVLDYKEGFSGPETDHRWSMGEACIWFLLSASDRAGSYRIAVEGAALPGRPAAISLNGHPLGTIDSAVPQVLEWTAPGEFLRPGAANRLLIEVPAAGPWDGDPRPLGFAFRRLRIEAIPPAPKTGTTPPGTRSFPVPEPARRAASTARLYSPGPGTRSR